MPLSPLAKYEQLLDGGEVLPDAEQRKIVLAFEALWRELATEPARASLFGLVWRRPEPVRGLYVWGGVGRGKTWLMDLFFDSLPPGGPMGGKQRIHFHRFMQRVHAALKKLGHERNPLQSIARQWAQDFRVLCLDEFFVSDIADAMLLAGLLRAMFDNGVTLVATSNLAPQELYRDGLQRAKFLPAIEMLQRHTRVMELGGDLDFRLRILEQSEIYHWPLDAQAESNLAASFARIAGGVELETEVDINDRPLQAVRHGDGVIWLEFAEMCGKPRGSIDYIEIARDFNTVLLSNVPQMKEQDSDVVRRFVTLIDEFYDRGVKLLVSAEVAIDELYTGQRLAFEFERTRSRLTEMQTHDYLVRPHLG
jgi:cell division protein ZapE